jgi:predicted ATP-grasp superfamily ATP-dependent carboligase
VLLETARALSEASVPYHGPGAAALERCYDKLEATRIARRASLACPETVLAPQAANLPMPIVLKPRRGSDSIGVRLVRDGAVPADERLLAQEWIRGEELTVALLGSRAGKPLRIELPPGEIYSFRRKYVTRPALTPIEDSAAEQAALTVAGALGVDWLVTSIATAAARSCSERRSATTVRERCASGDSFRLTVAIAPSIPNEPVKSRARS